MPRVLAIFLPLAFGYLVSYVFRTINGPLADELIHRFSLDAGSLGFITSVYFLSFTVAAIPIGLALDAFGPRHVQGWLMIVAAIGAIVFARAPSAPYLIAGRGLIGIGVAGSLMSGLKAHALWVSPRLLPLANGGLVMFGGLGAIVATLPVDVIDTYIGWRATFLILAGLSAVSALAIFVFLPRPNTPCRLDLRDGARGLIDAALDQRFLRIAPLSASVLGSAFAIHGLWAARWLADIEGFRPTEVVQCLLAMGIGLTIGALSIGAITTWLFRRGVAKARIFGSFCVGFMFLQLIVQLHVAISPTLLWGLIGAFGGMSALSYSILDTIFPSEVIGRANSALNILHLATAWGVQTAMGFVIARWPTDDAGHYPLVAYRVAFVLPLLLQSLALVWFLMAGARLLDRSSAPAISR